jgi:hypothetical protein
VDFNTPCTHCADSEESRATCGECRGIGLEILTQCPLDVVSDEAWELMPLLRFAREGQWPIGGGSLDQSQSFLDAMAVYMAERNKHEQAAWSE